MLHSFKDYEELDVFIGQYISGDFSTLDMEAILPVIEKLEPGQTYLEIGVKHGKSLFSALIAARDGVNIVGVDIEDSVDRQALFTTLGLVDRACFVHGESTRVARCWNTPIHCLFIDGNHSLESCRADIAAWAPFVPKGGTIMFHDCDESSPGVVTAVREAFGDTVRLYKTPTRNTSMASVIV